MHSGFLCALGDEIKVGADPNLLEGDDIESVGVVRLAERVSAGRRVERVALAAVGRVRDPVCDGCDALCALVRDEPQSPANRIAESAPQRRPGR